MLKPALLILLLLTSSSLLAETTEISEEIAVVEEIRGIEFEKAVLQKTITRAEFREFLKSQLDENLPLPVDEYFAVLRTLHLLDNEPDPLKKLFDLYEAQVLAFYDARTHIYYSLDTPPPAMAESVVPQSAVVVHELVHALQDQRFSAWQTMEKRKLDWDGALAYQAVLEGEATLVMMASLLKTMGLELDAVLREEMFLKLLSDPGQFQMGVPKDAPPYFVSSMIFPYVEGVKFAIHAYRRGGWAALDALHRKPPLTTEEVLHPEVYFAGGGKPSSPKPSAQGALMQTSLGEYHWKYLLDAEAAAGWESDNVRVLKAGTGPMTVLIDSSWDSERDALEFSSAMRSMLGKHSVEPSIRTLGRRVLVAYGGDQKAIRKFIK